MAEDTVDSIEVPSPAAQAAASIIDEILKGIEQRQRRRQRRLEDEKGHTVYSRPDPHEPRSALKAAAQTLLTNAQADAISEPVDMRKYNALLVQVFVSGTNATASVYVDGAASAGGLWLPEPWPSNGFVANSSVARTLEVASRFCRIRLANVSGTFNKGEGFTIVVTPYIAGTGAS